MMDDENGHTKAMGQPKVDYWAGYYDFLINEGSYKFWAVFQVTLESIEFDSSSICKNDILAAYLEKYSHLIRLARFE